MIPLCLDSRFTDGGKIFSLHTGRVLLPEILFVCFWYSFLLQAEKTPEPSEAGRIRYIEEIYSPHQVLNPRSSGL
jgi:hypothetical protein